MKIGIIEDERIAAQYLEKLLREIDSDIEICFRLDTVEAVSKQFAMPSEVDLIFSDIELLDGNIFSVFSDIEPPCPIIFATAYEEYAIKAFEANGVGYVLKPYDKVLLAKALEKFKRLTERDRALDGKLFNDLSMPQHKDIRYKQRFVIKRQSKIDLLAVSDISYFRLELSGLMAFDKSNTAYPLSHNSLSALEVELDPAVFFRLNRHEIISVMSIVSMTTLGKDRIEITVPTRDKPLICSAARTPDFKKWLEG
ncbi:MAG: LytR/AlgR family response regulator transcription factor [Psychrobium sp.]